MDPNGRIALAEIRGDVKLILAGQDRINADVHAIRKTLDRHDTRLLVLETDRAQKQGERSGIATTVKTLWLGGGAVVTAFVVAVLNKLGLI